MDEKLVVGKIEQLTELKMAARRDDVLDRMVPSDVRVLIKEIERLRALLVEATTNPEGDYYTGLRCGVEDRDIYDRYDAAEYGWDQAFEYVESIVANESLERDGK